MTLGWQLPVFSNIQYPPNNTLPPSLPPPPSPRPHSPSIPPSHPPSLPLAPLSSHLSLYLALSLHLSLSLSLSFIYLFIMSYLPRSTPSVRSTVLPGAPWGSSLRLLKIYDIHTLQQLKFYYKMVHTNLPINLNTLPLIRNQDIHGHNTRCRNKIGTIRTKHEFAKKM